jgi:hypothetical protein
MEHGARSKVLNARGIRERWRPEPKAEHSGPEISIRSLAVSKFAIRHRNYSVLLAPCCVLQAPRSMLPALSL